LRRSSNFFLNHMSGQALYVGGLDEAVTLDLLRAAFLPFGHVKDAQLPLDPQGAHKGFAFIEYELEEDAQAAIDNMEGAELFGRTIRVNVARAGSGSGGGGGRGGKAVWAEAASWYKNLKAQGRAKGEGGGSDEEGEGGGEEGGEGEEGAAMGGGGGSAR
jgi:peptidyl-prolyl isomerase E (cyclophilin E)